MNTNRNRRNTAAALALSSIAMLSIASAASADSGPWIRYKQGQGAPVQTQSRVIVHENSAVPALAGFIGGLVIGSAIHSHPVYVAAAQPCPVAYSYFDPYCGQSFVSLDAYADYWRGYDHPMMVRVVDMRSGQYVNTLRFCEGGWRDENWFRGPGRGHAYGRDGGWSRDRGDERNAHWSNNRRDERVGHGWNDRDGNRD
jgi:hypothetical protein